jgi:hypothetical protein
MPVVLKRAKGGKIKCQQYLSAGEVAFVLDEHVQTVRRLIDRGTLKGFRLPRPKRERRVSLEALVEFIKHNQGYKQALARIEDGEQLVTSWPEETPPLCPRCRQHVDTGPWTRRVPRSVRRGRLPAKLHYSVVEVAWLLGITRWTLSHKLRNGFIPTLRLPSRWPTSPFRYVITRPMLIQFLQEHPEYAYAWHRLEGEGQPQSQPQNPPRDQSTRTCYRGGVMKSRGLPSPERRHVSE